MWFVKTGQAELGKLPPQSMSMLTHLRKIVAKIRKKSKRMINITPKSIIIVCFFILCCLTLDLYQQMCSECPLSVSVQNVICERFSR